MKYRSMSLPLEAHALLEQAAEESGIKKTRVIFWIDEERRRLLKEVEFLKDVVRNLSAGQDGGK